MTELAAIVVALLFGIVAFAAALAARAIRIAQDRDRLHHEQLQLKAATEELHDLGRERELERWNNPSGMSRRAGR